MSGRHRPRCGERMRAWPLGWLIGGLLLLAPSAAGDVAVTGLSPTVAMPGERIDLRVGCGSCTAGASFPISLVGVAQTPRSHPCGKNRVCAPVAAEPPREPPFKFLGHTRGGRALNPKARPPGSQSRLQVSLPSIEPGRYSFVIYCAECTPGPGGSLIADTSDPNEFLQVHRGGALVDPGGISANATRWVAGATVIALLVAAVARYRG